MGCGRHPGGGDGAVYGSCAGHWCQLGDSNLTALETICYSIWNDRYVAVANEPFLKAYNGSNLETTFPALKNIQKAINEAGFGDKIKATIPQNADVYDSGDDGPSAGNFRSDIRQLMTQIVQYLRDNDAPFVVNIYPFLSLSLNANFPIEFAFFDGGAKPVQDKGTTYTNMLDANLDTLVWSLFSLTDENQKSVEPGEFERHWGVFQYDGQPKFPMDITGGGNMKMPVGAKDAKYLESKWCVLDSDVTDFGRVHSNMEYACSRGDCTALNYKGGCSKLDKMGKASYAFNMYFQINDQNVESCDFEGLAVITSKNASTNDCRFPIALESRGWRVRMSSGAVVGVVFALLLLL